VLGLQFYQRRAQHGRHHHGDQQRSDPTVELLDKNEVDEDATEDRHDDAGNNQGQAGQENEEDGRFQARYAGAQSLGDAWPGVARLERIALGKGEHDAREHGVEFLVADSSRPGRRVVQIDAAIADAFDD